MNLSDLFGGGGTSDPVSTTWVGSGNFGTVTVTSTPTIFYGIQIAITSGSNLTGGSVYTIRNGSTPFMYRTYEYLLRDTGLSWFDRGITLNSGLSIISTSVAAGVNVTLFYKTI